MVICSVQTLKGFFATGNIQPWCFITNKCPTKKKPFKPAPWLSSRMWYLSECPSQYHVPVRQSNSVLKKQTDYMLKTGYIFSSITYMFMFYQSNRNPDLQKYYSIVIHWYRVFQLHSSPSVVLHSLLDIWRQSLLTPEQHPGNSML